MSELRSGGAAPSRAVLTALRAAAVLIVASGVNEIIASSIERYEPLYVYLGAVALVTLLDGPLMGAVTASIATFLYALLFGPRPPVLDASVALPAVAGALVVVVFGAIGFVYRRTRRRHRPRQESPEGEPDPDTPLLEASIVTPAEEIVTALEEMRAELRGALVELSTARERERGLELELRAARAAAADDAERIVAGANRAVDALAARLQQMEEHSRAREEKLERAWGDAREVLSSRVCALEEDLARERGRVDGGGPSAERVAELEAATERAEADVVAARLEISQLTNDRNVVQRQLADAHATIDAVRREASELAAAAAASEARVEQLEAHAERDRAAHQVAHEMLRNERDAAQATSASLAKRVEELETALDAASDPQRIAELEAQLGVATSERDELRAAAAHAQTDFDIKLQSIVAHLAEDHEQDLGTAIMEKEAVRAEARGVSMKLDKLQHKIEEERGKWIAQKQALADQLRQAEERAARAVEDTTRVMTDARHSWQAELERLRHRVAELEKQQTNGAPAAPVDLSAPIPMPPPPESAPEPVRHRPRIVVVHPDLELREAARSSLVRVGYEVATAGDGLEGLRVAIAMQPDIVIADSQMPKMDGRELCQLLKSQEKTAHIKIVLLTRNVGERVDGADQVMKKPVPFDALRTALQELLAR